MITLGIETSCDETSCAVLDGRDRILSNVVSSSLFRHRPFGGIVPEIASRHSLEQIDTVYREALAQAKVTPEDIRLIAVTSGPGLIGSLLVGVCFAKSLAYALKVPLVGVNHLEAHITANFIGRPEPDRYIGLLISGGHTSLSFHQDGRSELMGETADDACGEAYDKVAKIVGLGFPGGPIIDRLAKEGNPRAFSFTRPKQESELDFSFSGIKTAVLYLVRGQKEISESFQKDLAASFQEAVVDWVVEKTFMAVRRKRAQHVVVGGGVSANSRLRARLQEKGTEAGVEVWLPPLALTGDNAAMIARQGIEVFDSGRRDSLNLAGNPNLKFGMA